MKTTQTQTDQSKDSGIDDDGGSGSDGWVVGWWW